MSNVVTREEYHAQTGFVGKLAIGALIGVAFAGWLMKPTPQYAAAPVSVLTDLDRDRIAAAVKAALPAPVAPVAAAPAPAKAAPVKVRKVHKVKAAPAPARLVYVVPHYHGCTCSL